MHYPSSSKSPSMSPARLPPFSLAEFRALVSAALDSDAPAPPLALSLRTSASHPALKRKKSVQNLHAAASSSRVRLMLSKLKKRAAALIVQQRRLSLPISGSTSSKSVDSVLFRPYVPLAAQYERASTSAPLAFTCAPGSPPPSPDSSECPCSSDASHAPPSPTASSFSATSSLSHSSRYSSADRPYSFIPDPALNGAGVYEDADPFAKGAVRVVHRSCEALPSTYSYHSANNNYAGYATSPRIRRTGRGRRVPIAPLIRARARELDVELRELNGEVEVGFVPTQFAVGKDEEQEEQEIDDSGIFLDEEPRAHAHRPDVPHRRIPVPPRPHCKDARTPGLAVPAEPVVVVVGVCVCVCGWSGDAGGLRALTPHPTPAPAESALDSPCSTSPRTVPPQSQQLLNAKPTR
ncbi:hypothetical protein B0H14DRAFT_3160076 [Mycena olivaceomarginata]|nr:hypothetical protein B0H14DRAFT_3160076 [Mycena olivaceomarginata]